MQRAEKIKEYLDKEEKAAIGASERKRGGGFIHPPDEELIKGLQLLQLGDVHSIVKFTTKGCENARLAYQYDVDKRFKDALEMYKLGLNAFMKSLKYEKKDDIKALLTLKCSQFMERAESIKEYVIRNPDQDLSLGVSVETTAAAAAPIKKTSITRKVAVGGGKGEKSEAKEDSSLLAQLDELQVARKPLKGRRSLGSRSQEDSSSEEEEKKQPKDAVDHGGTMLLQRQNTFKKKKDGEEFVPRDETMLVRAWEVLADALLADDKCDFPLAVKYYQRAIDLLVEGQMYSKDTDENDKAEQAVLQHMERLNELTAFVSKSSKLQ